MMPDGYIELKIRARRIETRDDSVGPERVFFLQLTNDALSDLVRQVQAREQRHIGEDREEHPGPDSHTCDTCELSRLRKITY